MQTAKNSAVQKKKTSTKTVTIETSGGITKKKVKSGGSVILPVEVNKRGYTFLGWSTVPGQTCNPMYQAYQKIQVTKNIHLYPVKYKWNQEPDIYAGGLADSVEKYDKIIFVGDSRTAGIQATLNKQMSSSVTNGVSFVANPGKGLSWFRDTGYAQLIEEIDKTEGSKPIAVIFNLGVNDLGNAGNYVSYMTSIASTLKSKNCKLFYMSVNPINSTMITKAGRGARTEAQVREFNSKIRSGLSLDYKYIDMYSVLMKKGYGTNASYNGTDADSDDGLHYTTKTFKRIYYYCITYLNTGSINASYY